MPLVSEMRHPHGFDFQTERSIARVRGAPDEHSRPRTLYQIFLRVKNLAGLRPQPRHVADTDRRFNACLGRAQYKYANCGRRPDKVSAGVVSYLVRTMQELRLKSVCTSTALQHRLAEDLQVKLSISWIRKNLHRKGFKWLARRQKRMYTSKERRARCLFARQLLALSNEQLKTKLAFAMGGVVLAMPPSDPIERLSFCRKKEPYMWRTPPETFSPVLSGDTDYGNQVSLARAVSMWGGCAHGGFSIVCFHQKRKLKAIDLARVVGQGHLPRAITDTTPVRPRGPWNAR